MKLRTVPAIDEHHARRARIGQPRREREGDERRRIHTEPPRKRMGDRQQRYDERKKWEQRIEHGSPCG
jgi:hypothetical protein